MSARLSAAALRVPPRAPRPAPAVPPPPHPMYDACAPLVHRVVALVALVLASPCFLAIAVLVRATSRGPVFYRGARVGQHARVFRICKFRTMVEDAEARIGDRLASDDDKRDLCTRVGRLLKKSKLDELPQLVNVLRGEMRLVGPRPVRPVFLRQFTAEIPGYARRFLVPPGITGVAQLRGGYYTAARDKHRYDLIYVARRSLRLDLQVILLTFVKILNRWLGMGLAVLVLFLFVSLAPANLHASLGVRIFGVHVSAISLAIAATALWTAVRRRSAGFSLYRCPLNVAIPLFVVLGVMSAARAPDARAALQATGYYLATGLLLAFLIVNTLASRAFFRLTVRAVALTSVVVSLLALVRLFAINYGGVAVAGSAAVTAGDPLRLSWIAGGPVVLAVYLVLGLPILVAEVVAAETRRARDFWLVGTTISFVGIVFTQTRVGLLALLVSGAVFLYRRHRRAVTAAVLAGAVLLAGVLTTVHLRTLAEAPTAALGLHRAVLGLRAVPARTWLLGGDVEPVRADRPAPADAASNMHLTFAREQGVASWLLFMWLVLAVLRAMKRAHDRMRDERLRRSLWAIISSIAGFLVSMNAINAFHYLPVQVFFWSLVGIGLGIAIQLGGPRGRHNMIWRFGDAGD